MGRRSDEAQLAVAEQHFSDAERIIARQIHSIALLKLNGADTTGAEQKLTVFKESLKAFRRDRDSILRDTGREAS